MREIKFRVFDKPANKMITPENNDYFSLGLDGSLWYGNGQMTKEAGAIEYPAPVMQFTGLKDKNGKEIFEGDVVRTNFDKTDQYDAYTEVGVVNITPYRTEIEDKKHGKYNRFYSHSEVIGNIYENPELLQRQE